MFLSHYRIHNDHLRDPECQEKARKERHFEVGFVRNRQAAYVHVVIYIKIVGVYTI
jgi:hypothetical protein